MKWDGQEESQNVEDGRGSGGGGMGGSRTLLAGGGGLVVLILALIFKVDPATITRFLGGGNAPQNNSQVSGPPRVASPEEEDLRKKTSMVLKDTEIVWSEQFKKRGLMYVYPTLHFFTDHVESACGSADVSVGPFYCGGDKRIYIDLTFYREMQDKLHAPGEFARAYVVAHEVGHHVQRLLGYTKRESEAARAEGQNQASVRLELQADYLAGVWSHYADEKFKILEPGDVESALKAAFEIGDDRLQKQSRGTVRPDTFTHGTSKQRMYWFNKGFSTGDVEGASALFDLPYGKL